MLKAIKKRWNKLFDHWYCTPVLIIGYLILLTIGSIAGELWRAHVLFEIGFDGILLLFY